MIILVSQYGDTYKAQIRSSRSAGFKPLYNASCTMGSEEAAKAVVRKWYGDAAAETVAEVRDAATIREHIGDFNSDPKRKQVFDYFLFDDRAKAGKSAKAKTTKEKSAQKPRKDAAVVVLPTLPEIVDRLAETQVRLDKAKATYERTTLADYVWIGVCCLAAQEHHAMGAAEKGALGGRGKKAVLRVEQLSEVSAEIVHPQGFLSWIKTALPWCAQPTAYKYIDAAKGAGFTAYSTEEEVRKRIGAWLKEWEKRHGKPLSLSALVAQGKTIDPNANGKGEPEKSGPSIDKIKFDAIREFSVYAKNLGSIKHHFSPEDTEVVTNELANTLREITGYEWQPVAK